MTDQLKHQERVGEGRYIALVTGASGAIGEAIARQIAAKPNYEVVLLCRNEAKAQKSLQNIQKATGNRQLSYELVNLSRRSSVAGLAGRWQKPVHVLVNNAAITPPTRQETPEGLELQFATNIMGYVWMMQAFKAAFLKAGAARVVNVASYWAGDLDINDLEFKRRPYNNNTAYRQSKQANRMLTAAFAKAWSADRIAVNACHPGDVNSLLSNNLGFGGHETPDEGAATPVWLATTSVGQQQTGKYFEHLREVRCRFGANQAAVETLYQACAGYSDFNSLY